MAPDNDQRLLDQLLELLRIPSISTDGGDPEALQKAADWVAARIREAGGEIEMLPVDPGPLVVGRFAANRPGAPTVMIYGHYDVQSVGSLDEWTSPPFEPEIRGDRIYARGASDDKGNFLPLLYTACRMAESGELPVNVRVVVEGAEESGSGGILKWIEEDEEGADCCIIYDSGSIDPSRPALTLGSRGVMPFRITVTAADHDLHSGIYGGAVFNSLHVLTRILDHLLPDADGVVKSELRQGVQPVPDAELKSWRELPPPEMFVRATGGWPISESALRDYYERNWGQTSLDVNKIEGGEERTVIPAKAAATLSVRLAPGQQTKVIGDAIRKLIDEATPAGVKVEVEARPGVEAAAFDPELEPLRIAREALQKAAGIEPLLIRIGGTLPLMAPLYKRGIPTILTGFATLIDGFHGPNESYSLESLRMGKAAAEQLLLGLAALKPR